MTRRLRRSTGRADDIAPRTRLLAEARQRLLTHGWPRAQASLIVGASGAGGFLASVGLLHAGLDGMAARYGIAALVAYGTFVVLVGLWVRLHRSGESVADALVDVTVDALDPSLPRGTSAMPTLYGGGASGGGGGGASFDEAVMHGVVPIPEQATSGPASSSGGWIDGLFDEDGVFILLAVICLGAGLVAVVYVVYAAPVLLAEVALDAALFGALYRRLRRDEQRHWSRGLLRATWVPALVIVLSAVGVGYFLQRAVPGARSIGGVMAGLGDGR